MIPRRRLALRTALRSLGSQAFHGATLLAPAIVRAAPAIALAAAVLLAASVASARPGGGSSFGGGSKGGGGGGGSGGGGDCGAIFEIVFFLVQLTIEYPAIGIPIDIVVIGIVVWALASKSKANKQRDWDTTRTAASFAAGAFPC